MLRLQQLCRPKFSPLHHTKRNFSIAQSCQNGLDTFRDTFEMPYYKQAVTENWDHVVTSFQKLAAQDNFLGSSVSSVGDVICKISEATFVNGSYCADLGPLAGIGILGLVATYHHILKTTRIEHRISSATLYNYEKLFNPRTVSKTESKTKSNISGRRGAFGEGDKLWDGDYKTEKAIKAEHTKKSKAALEHDKKVELAEMLLDHCRLQRWAMMNYWFAHPNTYYKDVFFDRQIHRMKPLALNALVLSTYGFVGAIAMNAVSLGALPLYDGPTNAACMLVAATSVILQYKFRRTYLLTTGPQLSGVRGRAPRTAAINRLAKVTSGLPPDTIDRDNSLIMKLLEPMRKAKNYASNKILSTGAMYFGSHTYTSAAILSPCLFIMPTPISMVYASIQSISLATVLYHQSITRKKIVSKYISHDPHLSPMHHTYRSQRKREKQYFTDPGILLIIFCLVCLTVPALYKRSLTQELWDDLKTHSNDIEAMFAWASMQLIIQNYNKLDRHYRDRTLTVKEIVVGEYTPVDSNDQTITETVYFGFKKLNFIFTRAESIEGERPSNEALVIASETTDK